MKKLIPAICLLLVAACLMGTSTYAWFSMTSTASVSGMKVKAIAKGGLAVASYTVDDDKSSAKVPASSAFSNTATAVWLNDLNTDGSKKTVVDINPVSYSLTQKKWYKATAASVDNYAASGNYDEVSSKGYYLQAKYQVKQIGTPETAQYLYVTGITVTAGAATSEVLNKSIRVMIIVNNTKTTVFAPNYGTTGTDSSAVLYNVDTTTTKAANSDIVKGTSGNTKIYDTALGDDALVVDVYVYYEGEDENCLSNNALNVADLDVSITFSAAN